jgi:hypothetical protein
MECVHTLEHPEKKSYLSIGKVKEKIFFALLLLYDMAKPHIYEGKKKRTLFLTDVVKFDTK